MDQRHRKRSHGLKRPAGILAGIETLTQAQRKRKISLPPMPTNRTTPPATPNYLKAGSLWARPSRPANLVSLLTLDYMTKKAKGLADTVAGTMSGFTILSDLEELAALAETMTDGYRYAFAQYVQKNFLAARMPPEPKATTTCSTMWPTLEEPGSSLQAAVQNATGLPVDEFQDTDEMQ